MIKSVVNNITIWFEQKAYGVCNWWGNKLGIKSNTIRMYFIYLSFFTAGSPIIVYFIMAFILEHKNYFKPIKKKKKTVWDF